MSFDLIFLPLGNARMGHDKDFPVAYSHNILEVGSNMDWFSDLEELSKTDGIFAPDGFTSYFGTVPDGQYEGERCYGKVSASAYGKALKMLTVKQLIQFFKKISEDNLSWQTKAALAYTKALPSDLYVVLYWS